MKAEKYLKAAAVLFILIIFILPLSGCDTNGDEAGEVVIYTSVDQMYSEIILNEFEAETGIKVLPIYDVEATKTTGMVNRLIAEQERPQADVFWNGEILQTIRLKESGALTTFTSPSAENIPGSFKDPEGYWVSYAGRARIIIANTDLLEPEEYPTSIYDLLDPAWPAGEVCIAYPMFGTTATHAAALYAYLGPEEGAAYHQTITDRGVAVLDGNSVTRDMVAEGRMLFGMTDTDDACVAIQDGDPVKIILPDQEPGGLGALVIPNSICMIKDGPNPEEAQILIDYLLSEEVEKRLLEIGWAHLPVRDIPYEPVYFEAEGARLMEIDFASMYEQFDRVMEEMNEIFIR